jgi:hypothetical protein
MAEKTKCQDCGQELSWPVVEAGNFLYHGGTLSVNDLTERLERDLRPPERARWDAERAQRYNQTAPITDFQIVRLAVESLVMSSFTYDDLAAAVQHYGNLGDPDGSECERIEAAKWCHERGPGKDSQDSAVWAASLCSLEAGHAEPHSFEQTKAEAAL